MNKFNFKGLVLVLLGLFSGQALLAPPKKDPRSDGMRKKLQERLAARRGGASVPGASVHHQDVGSASVLQEIVPISGGSGFIVTNVPLLYRDAPGFLSVIDKIDLPKRLIVGAESALQDGRSGIVSSRRFPNGDIRVSIPSGVFLKRSPLVADLLVSRITFDESLKRFFDLVKTQDGKDGFDFIGWFTMKLYCPEVFPGYRFEKDYDGELVCPCCCICSQPLISLSEEMVKLVKAMGTAECRRGDDESDDQSIDFEKLKDLVLPFSCVPGRDPGSLVGHIMHRDCFEQWRRQCSNRGPQTPIFRCPICKNAELFVYTQ